ncbi:MAG: hypothetical protein HUJ80_08540, partial [Firmicutes bacterium]|nr:hypothetical protein [Bacillota bacterium]
YYLQSRYYSPQVGRFVNGDGLIDTDAGFTGCNLYVYAANSPLMYIDVTGTSAVLATTALFVGLTVTATICVMLCSDSSTNRDLCAAKHMETSIEDLVNGLKEAQKNHILNNHLHDHKWSTLFKGKKPDWTDIAPVIYKVLKDGTETVYDESKGIYVKSMIIDGCVVIVRYLKDVSGTIVKISDGWVK